MKIFLAILWKDCVCEWRSRERVVSMAIFALLATAIFHFALASDDLAAAQRLAPGLLWTIFLFASVLGLNRSFAAELENDALSGLALAPADRGWILLGKAAANALFLYLVQLLSAAIFAAFFDVQLAPVAWPFAGIAALGALGLSSIGSLLAALAARTRTRDVLLPLLLFPLLVPLLLGAVRATAGLIETGRIPSGPLQLLLVVDAVFLILSFITFEFVLDE